MKFSTMAWVLGSTLVIAGMGVGAAACSSGGSGTPTQGNDSGTHGDTGTPTGDSGHPNGDSGIGPMNDTGTTPTDSGTPPGDTGTGSPDCGTFPTLHPGSMNQLYCPFGPEAGAPIYCAAGTEYCCISGKVGGVYPPSDCEAISAGGCTAVMQMVQGSTQIQCEDPMTDCPAGNVCCASPAPQAVAGCGYSKITGWAYSKCEMGTACAAGETQICESAAECPMGQMCCPMKAKGVQMGFCAATCM